LQGGLQRQCSSPGAAIDTHVVLLTLTFLVKILRHLAAG